MIRKRRAVGGLISLIGLIVVFGIASVAYLELSSSQTNLTNTSFIMNQKIADKNNERLNFTSVTPVGNNFDVTIENLASQTIVIHSYITKNGNSVVGKNELGTKIFAGDENTITNIVGSSDANDKILFITSLGKKCLVPEGVSYRLC